MINCKMANYLSSRLFSWFLIFLYLLLQIQTGRGSNATSMGVIELTVGVPKKDGFTEFVDVVWDSREKKFIVSGYCMDIFYAVIELLPFDVSPKVEPYVNQLRESAGTYDSLVQQVSKKYIYTTEQYDMVVGDIAIVANRSQFVDFTLPYAQSGVRMVVPIQHGRQQNMWIFVKPFSWDLWLGIVIISIFIGFVILIMERKAHTLPDQRDQAEGSPVRKQLSAVTVLWFPISQAVLPERQVVAKNCSRFVLMVWLLLAFVLMQSYTANLTSILTLDQIQPSFLSVDDLREGSHFVGYQAGSFVYDLLVKQLKFNPSKLIPYSSISGYHRALKIGSQGGGVSAIFDEVPCLDVFLRKYRSDYIIAGPTYRTAGFGFAFPLNSSLTSHFSRAILHLIESNSMNDIEGKYFGNKNERELVQSAQMSSASPLSLTIHSFAGLFLITGISTLLALLVSETVIWQKPILTAKACFQRYLLRTPPSTETRVHPTHDSTREMELMEGV